MEIRISKLTLLAAALIVLGVVLRVVPHTANVAPIGALALFGGAVLGWRLALWLPLTAMAVSDLIIGTHDTMLFTWGAFALIALLGLSLQNVRNRWRVLFGAVGSAVIFFVVSNFGVWLAGNMYAPTLAGLQECFVAALPFFRATLLSDLAFSVLFFGAFALAGKRLHGQIQLRLHRPVTAAS